jgi:peptidoglycan/LPS O-acetylase OafA/YrhL
MRRDLPTDGLRGLCALLVFSAHLFLPLRMLDPRYAPPEATSWLDLGTPAVLMFFILSGYVIGLTISGPLGPAALKHYSGRRVLRLVPMVYLAVALSWMLDPHVGGRTVVGNLIFLQNNFSYPLIGGLPLLPDNPNLWSLHYEVVYYAGFVAIWWLAPPVFLPFLALLVLGTASSLGYPVPPLLTRYACGALFWISGLCLAWGSCAPDGLKPHRSNWPSALLAAYAIWIFCPLRQWLLRHGDSDVNWPNALLPHRLDFLPFCLWAMSATSGRAASLRRGLTAACLGWACWGAVYTVLIGAWSSPDWLAAAALAISLVLAGRESDCELLSLLAPVGGISFGIYIFAGPIQLAQRALAPGFSGSVLTYGVRLLCVVLVTLGVSWLVERRLQPWIASRVGSPARPAS